MDDRKQTTAVLLGLFIGSGCSALIYEIVWLQQLGLVLGATTISLAILLTSFMGGMCLGSVLLPRWVSAVWHPLRVYAVLELLIGACGLAALGLMPQISRVYCAFGAPGSNDLTARAVLALTMLLPPTICMGATLPAIARWVRSTPAGLSGLGFFYGANTFGAVLGSLLAGLYLLPVFDVVVATSVAAAINVGVAVVAWRLARGEQCGYVADAVRPLGITCSQTTALFGSDSSMARFPEFQDGPNAEAVRHHDEPSSAMRGMVHFVVGCSGLTALGAEVVWTRWLGLLFGPTTYTFSILLAVFLLGLGLGSWGGAGLARRLRFPGLALAASQWLLMAAIPFGAFMIVSVLPYWLQARDAHQSLTMRMSLDVLRALAAFLPATLLWGASFSLAAATLADARRDSARLVGGLYAANTLGAIFGTLVVSLCAIPWVDGQFAQQLLTVCAGVSGTAMLVGMTQRPTLSHFAGVSAIAISGCAALLFVPAVPKGLLAYGRTVNRWPTIREYYFAREGLNSPVVVALSAEGYVGFHVAGKVEATNSPWDMRTQRLLGHLPAMIHPSPRTALVVGCGSGMTAGALLRHPTIDRIVLCEMEPNVIHTARQFFAKENGSVLDDSRVTVVIDDARHFLATTREKFDIITADPIHPWVRGAASLYTAEFYELCRARLTPQGVVTQWVPLYESNSAAVKCELATFVQQFPRSSVWSGVDATTGYDFVVVGTIGDQEVSAQTIARRLWVNSDLQRSLAQIGMPDAHHVLAHYEADAGELTEWLRDAPINRDRNLRLQYLAGLSPELQIAKTIRQQMVSR